MSPIFFDKDTSVGGGAPSAKKLSIVDRELVTNYEIAMTRIKNKIRVLYDKHGTDGVLTFAEASKYKRLDKLFKEINREVGKLTGRVQKITYKSSEEILLDSFDEISGGINTAVSQGVGFKMSLPFGGINPDVIRAAVENPLNKIAIKDLTDVTRTQLRREITQSLLDGESYFDLSKKVKERLDVSAGRALRIARTEAGKAYSKGHLEAHNRAEELGVVMHKVWHIIDDGRQRKSHDYMKNQVADKDGYFKFRDGTKIQGPRLGGPAREIVNCRCRMLSVVKGYEPESFVAESLKEEILPGEVHNPEDAGKMIREKKHEECFAFDGNGEKLLYKRGGRASVSFSDRDVKVLKKASTLIHNHPGSSSFSKQDIQLAFHYGITDMQVVSKEYDYFIKEKLSGIKFNKENWLKIGKPKYNIVYQEVKRSLNRQIRNKEITVDEANKLLLHLVWSKLSDNLGFKYERRSIK